MLGERWLWAAPGRCSRSRSACMCIVISSSQHSWSPGTVAGLVVRHGRSGKWVMTKADDGAGGVARRWTRRPLVVVGWWAGNDGERRGCSATDDKRKRHHDNGDGDNGKDDSEGGPAKRGAERCETLAKGSTGATVVWSGSRP
jgi:hypothetical protein